MVVESRKRPDAALRCRRFQIVRRFEFPSIPSNWAFDPITTSSASHAETKGLGFGEDRFRPQGAVFKLVRSATPVKINYSGKYNTR
jgi:hypothetical protein